MVNAPHNPTGMPAGARELRRSSPEIAADAGATLLVRRGLPVPRARPGRPAPGRRRPRRARRLARRDVEVVRAGRAADRLDRDAATARCSTRRRGSRTTRRSAPRRRPRSWRSSRSAPGTGSWRGRGRSSPRTSRSSTASSRAGPTFALGPPRGGSIGFPRAPGADAHRPVRRGPARGRGRPARAGLDLRPRRATTSGSASGATNLPVALGGSRRTPSVRCRARTSADRGDTGRWTPGSTSSTRRATTSRRR